MALHHYWTKGSPENVEIKSQSRYQLSNHLDSVSLEVNDNAEIMTYEEYLPFGGTALIAGKTAREVTEKEYRYSGKERDESTGLYYYGARYYAPWLLRGINPDPAGTVDGLNLYQFVKGNTIIYRDVKGEEGETVEDKFEQGDKFYGLSKQRISYMKAVKEKHPNATNLVIDNLNNLFIGTGAVVNNWDLEPNYFPINHAYNLEAGKFKLFIEAHNKYNPSKTPGVIDKVGREYDDEDLKKIRSNAFIRVGRASKAGIEFTTLARDRKVHFVLDGLDLGAVAQKIPFIEIRHIKEGTAPANAELARNNRGGTLKDVTGQELRFLYRNRDNQEMMNNVIFWKDKQIVKAPWESSEPANVYERNTSSGLVSQPKSLGGKKQKPLRKLWAGYVPKSQGSNQGNSTSTLKKFSSRIKHMVSFQK